MRLLRSNYNFTNHLTNSNSSNVIDLAAAEKMYFKIVLSQKTNSSNVKRIWSRLGPKMWQITSTLFAFCFVAQSIASPATHWSCVAPINVVLFANYYVIFGSDVRKNAKIVTAIRKNSWRGAALSRRPLGTNRFHSHSLHWNRTVTCK